MKHLLVVVVLGLAGCANPYAAFYFDQTGGVDITQSDRVVLTGAPPKVYRGQDPEADRKALLQNGYAMVGYSHFNAASASEPQLMAHAKKVHAEMVVTYSTYTNTVSGNIPLTMPNTTTSTTTMTGSAHGPSGYTSMSGTAYTTSTGTQTTYIPYSTNRYDFAATYWVKLKPFSFGVYFDDLSPEVRRQIGSNKGVIITTVVNDSPAFMADIFEGDILRSFNGSEIVNSIDFQEMISTAAGQTIEVEVLRGSETLIKMVQLRE